MPYSTLAPLLLLPVAFTSIWRAWPLAGGSSWLVLGWVGWLTVAFAISPTTGASLPMTAMLLSLPLALLAGQGLRARGHLDLLCNNGFPIILLLLVLWGLLQGPNTATQKPQGPLNDPNAYAALLNLLVLPILARYLASDLAQQAPLRRVLHLALLGATALIAFLVASRGASLALLLVSIPLFLLGRKQPEYTRKIMLLGTVCVVAYFAAYFASNGANVAMRLVNTLTAGDAPRLMLIKSAWLMIQDYPWIGTGLGRFHILYPQYRMANEFGTGGGWVHNDYLQVWVEAGLPMFLLLLALVIWVVHSGWKTFREGGADALIRMGFLAGLAACLLHALVNFLLFFSIISILLGLYLARVARPGVIDDSAIINTSLRRDLGGKTNPVRAIRMASAGYVFALGWLLLGDVLVDGLLVHSHTVQTALRKIDVNYPRYQVAYWLSVLSPFHPTPQYMMGMDLAEASMLFSGDRKIMGEALARLEAGWQLAPCYLPYGNDILFTLRQVVGDAELRARGLSVAKRNLECNARHGLSYYHAGVFAASSLEAIEWWKAGLMASPYLGDHLLLATAIASRTTLQQKMALSELAEQIAHAVSLRDSNPSQGADQVYWHDLQYKAHALAGPLLQELMPSHVPPLQ